MASKKTASVLIPKSNKDSKSKITKLNLAKAISYSPKHLIAFALVFGLLGSYFMYNSFAASREIASLEGENMSIPQGLSIDTEQNPGVRVVEDPTASGGKALRIRRTDVTVAGTFQLTKPATSTGVVVKAASCVNKSPNMELLIDDVSVIPSTRIVNTSWTEYAADIQIPAGQHVLKINMTKPDIPKAANHCMVALFVDVTKFYKDIPPPTFDYFKADPTSVARGGSSTLSWSVNHARSCMASGDWSGAKATSGSESTGPLQHDSTYQLSCTGPGGTTSAPPVTVTVTGPTYLFDDEFNGTGAPNPNYWIPLSWHISGSETKADNVFQDGSGSLVLRTRRDSTTRTGFSGAWVNTFSWDGHPAHTIKAKVAPAFRVETRMRMADVDGSWPGLWTNDATSPATRDNPMLELDISEERTTFPTQGICHYHLWGNGNDLSNGGGRTDISNMRTNWHVYWANVYGDHAVIGVDDQTCGTMNYGNWTLPNGDKFRVTSQSFLFWNLIANPDDPAGRWASGGKQPPANDPGPWDALVDYIRVTAL